MEAKKEPPVRLEGQPQPSFLASNLDPRLIHHETSNPPNRETIVQMAEALNPTPDRDVTPRTDILKTG
jgi:hypothetical protein